MASKEPWSMALYTVCRRNLNGGFTAHQMFCAGGRNNHQFAFEENSVREII